MKMKYLLLMAALISTNVVAQERYSESEDLAESIAVLESLTDLEITQLARITHGNYPYVFCCGVIGGSISPASGDCSVPFAGNPAATSCLQVFKSMRIVAGVLPSTRTAVASAER